MKEYRLGKDTTARYSSFEELRIAIGKDPVSKRTSDEKKLSKQRDNFLKKCPCCHQSLNYISGTNVVACKNINCKGIKKELKQTDEDGNKKVMYIPYTRMLDDLGLEIAQNIFD